MTSVSKEQHGGELPGFLMFIYPRLRVKKAQYLVNTEKK